MSFYDNRYYRINKLHLAVVGVWPYQSRLQANIMVFIAAFGIISLTLVEMSGLTDGITDITIVIENVSPVLANIFIFVKLVNFVFYKNNMKDLLDRIEQHWGMMQVESKMKILECYAAKSKSMTIKYTTALYLTWISYSSMPIFIAEEQVLLPANETYQPRLMYYILDTDKYYNALIIHCFFGVFFTVQVALAIDSMFIMCIQHACALFKIISYDMESIGKSDHAILKPNIENDEAYHAIVKCIKIYNHATEFSELLSSSFATSYFLLLGILIMSFSFNAAQLMMMDNQLDDQVQIMSSSSAQLLHIYYLSYMSQQLIDYSSELHEVIYSCNWYMISIRSRKLLILTLLRTMKPCQIWAGKMYIMSMENFGSILKVSLSYFTMLTSLQ